MQRFAAISQQQADAARQSGASGAPQGDALPAPLLSQFSQASGHDLSQVRIHTDRQAHQSAQKLNARAFAFGQNIHFGAGEFDPASRQGQRLIAHEVAHTLQQRICRSDTPPASNPARASAAAEQEADAFADAFLRGESFRLSQQTGAPQLALSPKDGPGHKTPELPGTRRVALSTSLHDFAFQFGPLNLAGRKLELSLRLALKGSVKGVLPEAEKPAKGQKAFDPGPASALQSLRLAISQAKPLVMGSVMTLDIAGAELKIGLTQAGKSAQRIMSVHAKDKLTLRTADLEFVGSAKAQLLTTVFPVLNAAANAGPGADLNPRNPASTADIASPDAAALADGEGVLSELVFLGHAPQLKDAYEGKGHDAKLKPHTIASADPAMISKLRAVKALLDQAEAPLRNEIMEKARARAEAANQKKPAKKQLDSAALAAQADADGRKALAKTELAGRQFGATVGDDEAALGLLDFMRPWFGSDEKTIAHFQKMRRVDGQPNLLAHDALATRLEAVQEKMKKRYPELGQKAYPHTSVGWSFRHKLQLGTRVGHANMHMLGQAVDFDAYNLPMMNPGETRALIRAVTGRSNALFQPGQQGGKKYEDYGQRRAAVRAMDQTKPQAKTDEAFLASLSQAIDATAKASYAFRHSLDTPPATGAAEAQQATDAAKPGPLAPLPNDDLSSGWVQFDALRNAWADATEMADGKEKEAALAKVQKDIESLLRPWLVKIEAHQQLMLEQALAKNKVDLRAPMPQPAPLQKAEKPLKALAAKLAKKPATALTQGEQQQIAEAAKLAGFTLPDPVNAAAVAALLEQVSASRISAEAGLKARKVVAEQDAAYWWDGELKRKLLQDRAFLFGRLGYNKERKRTWGESVDQPGAGQILRRGWFRVAQAGATGSTPSKEFMLEMAQHGFELGAAWGSSDSMHYELAVKHGGLME
ncbi:DUF4157 domain-containing protein [Massilia sp. W12]|uniref:eCIS core domain-containing protein n=1 Tax=Massilia sp. W12 TaxID=3126507 RepID=UPI0030D35D64